MQLIQNAENNVAAAVQRATGLRAHFVAFRNRLEPFFVGNHAAIRGVTLGEIVNESTFSVTYARTTIEFRLQIFLPPDRLNAVGRVSVVLREPEWSDPPPVVGTFTYSGNGNTDFEVPPNSEPIELIEHAYLILFTFMEMALRRSLP